MKPGATTWFVASIDARALERRLGNGLDATRTNAQVPHGVELGLGIHHAAVRDDEIVGGRREGPGRASRQRERHHTRLTPRAHAGSVDSSSLGLLVTTLRNRKHVRARAYPRSGPLRGIGDGEHGYLGGLPAVLRECHSLASTPAPVPDSGIAIRNTSEGAARCPC